MIEILNEIGNVLLNSLWEPIFKHWPRVSGGAVSVVLLILAIWKYRANKSGYKRHSLEIHYTFKSRSEISFESVSEIIVLRKGVKEFRTAIHGTREEPHIESRDPNMHVVLDPNHCGDVRLMTVHFDLDVEKGEKVIIPLIGFYVDGSMAQNPRFPFRLPTHLKQLVVVVQLPATEKVKNAFATIQKSGQMDLEMKKPLFVWSNNVFSYVFHDVKPKLIYELMWEYDNPAKGSNSRSAARNVIAKNQSYK